MAELKEGQQIIFRHPHSGKIYAGFCTGPSVLYRHLNGKTLLPEKLIQEWCDAEVAFDTVALATPGNFNWAQPKNEGPTVEPFYPDTEV